MATFERVMNRKLAMDTVARPALALRAYPLQT